MRLGGDAVQVVTAQMVTAQMPTIGDAFKALRLSRGLRQDTVAGLGGPSVSALYQMEREDYIPKRDSLEKLARAYGMTLPSLLMAVAQLMEPGAQGLPPISQEAITLALLYDSLGAQEQESVRVVAEQMARSRGGRDTLP